MFRLIRAASFLLVATSISLIASADQPPPQTNPNPPSPVDVLSTVTADFNSDGGFDRAYLVDNHGLTANLYIYLSNYNRTTQDWELNQAVYVPLMVFNGYMWGQQPSLEIANNGSLLVHQGNDGMGRDHWAKTETIAYRNSEFVVAGITLRTWDTLDHNHVNNCDLNLLTGHWLRNGQTVPATMQAVKLADWTEEMTPEACHFE